jgi:hypothetical protein
LSIEEADRVVDSGIREIGSVLPIPPAVNRNTDISAVADVSCEVFINNIQPETAPRVVIRFRPGITAILGDRDGSTISYRDGIFRRQNLRNGLSTLGTIS